MEMFNEVALKERLGPLKKQRNLWNLEGLERHLLMHIKKYGVETSYDVLAGEMPYFKTMGYTEYATNFYMQPLNLKIREDSIQDAYDHNVEDVKDFAGYLRKNIEEGQANKYKDRKIDTTIDPEMNLVILPGSNKLHEHVCKNKLDYIKKKHGKYVLFKPHPITTHAVIGELKDMYGEHQILDRNLDMYYYMQHADKVYSTHLSESALYALVLGKEIEPIDVLHMQHRGSFYPINQHLFDRPGQDGIDWVNRVFSSYKSGIINPAVDNDWREKIDQYLEYIMKKRKFYKNFYLDYKP